MKQTVQLLSTPYKGILAADESTPSIAKKFANIGLISTPELNKKYREMLFTTPDIEKYISGVILYDETIKQGLGDILIAKEIAVGIKVDEGLESFNETEEKITKGLEGLSDRLDEYKKLGATFTKWRAVFKISDIYPSEDFINQNLSRMADYAKLVQDKGMVPIVEPEVLLDGKHTNTRCEEITTKVLRRLFEILKEKNVDLASMVLKASMVIPGKESGVIVMPLEVSNSTLRTLQNSVPNEVPLIVFLSGGQTAEQSVFNLNEIAKLNKGAKFGQWDLSFSFGRALQDEALSVWNGKDENLSMAQKQFIKIMSKASLASVGELSEKQTDPIDLVIQKTKSTYSEIHKSYLERTAITINKDTVSNMDEFVKRIKGNLILDIGCAGGNESKYFQERGKDVTGIDFTPEFISEAKKTCPKCNFLEMDMMKLEFEDNHFDGIWANASFLHIPKDHAKQTLEGFSRVLKHGGLIFISVFDGESDGYRKNSKQGWNDRHFSDYDTNEIKELLQAAKFENIDISTNSTDVALGMHCIFANKGVLNG